jgi:hypothetical protein
MDGRLLIDITNLENESKEVQKLKPVKYRHRNNPAKEGYGFVSQELSKVDPLLIDVSLNVDYHRVIALLTAYVKDLETRVSILENNLKIDKKRNASKF